MKNFINALDILIVSLNKTIAVLGLASGTLLDALYEKWERLSE